MHIAIDQPLTGNILDLGGGGEGVIGRAYGHQVTAIDNRQDELDEAPGGFQKILMDATDLSFPDAHFSHVTSFFTMMYMDLSDQRRTLHEAARVLKPGGQLHIWDTDIDTAAPDPFLIDLDILLPAGRIHTTYGILRPDARQDAAHFIRLCKGAGLQLAAHQTYGRAFYLRFVKGTL